MQVSTSTSFFLRCTCSLTVGLAVLLGFLPGSGTTLNVFSQESADNVASSSEESDLAIFTSANQRFETFTSAKDLLQAARGYESLLEKGINNGHLYYNLGNTYLKLDDLGKAILNFRRALLLDPANDYALAMLGEAQSQIRNELPDLHQEPAVNRTVRVLFFWHFQLSWTYRLRLLIACSLAFWLVLSTRLFTRFPLQRFSIVALAILSLALGTSLAVEKVKGHGEAAVITAPETEVRRGNGKEYELAIDRPVPSGVEVRILETRGLWHLVEFPSETTGWVFADAIEIIDTFESVEKFTR